MRIPYLPGRELKRPETSKGGKNVFFKFMDNRGFEATIYFKLDSKMTLNDLIPDILAAGLLRDLKRDENVEFMTRDKILISPNLDLSTQVLIKNNFLTGTKFLVRAVPRYY